MKILIVVILSVMLSGCTHKYSMLVPAYKVNTLYEDIPIEKREKMLYIAVPL